VKNKRGLESCEWMIFGSIIPVNFGSNFDIGKID
jgi:hypothetical protein